jgi:NAD(P)-dependent dehydrogenase (short-subunit alcohol dehydrogenase family)
MRHAAAYWRESPATATGERRRIVNTTSPSGLFSVGNANYCAAKAGVAGVTVLAARELASYDVTVNAVAPRAMTRMTRDIPRIQAGASATATGLVPYAPEHVSTLVRWLAGDRAESVSGHVFLVYGGFLGIVDGWTTGPLARSESGWKFADLDEIVPDLVRQAAPAAGINGERPAEAALTIGTQ